MIQTNYVSRCLDKIMMPRMFETWVNTRLSFAIAVLVWEFRHETLILYSGSEVF